MNPFNYTNLTWEELLVKTKDWFNSPKAVTEALKRLRQQISEIISFEDAPQDGEQYARQDGDWTVVEASAGIESISGDFVDNTDPLNPVINVDEVNLGDIINNRLAIKSTPSANDEIVALDSITGEAVTIKYSDLRPYKVYTALLTQGALAPPVATVLENTLGGSVIWTYEDVGTYAANLTNAFTLNTTAQVTNGNMNGGISYAYRQDLNKVFVESWSLSSVSAANTILNKAVVEIRVYN